MISSGGLTLHRTGGMIWGYYQHVTPPGSDIKETAWQLYEVAKPGTIPQAYRPKTNKDMVIPQQGSKDIGGGAGMLYVRADGSIAHRPYSHIMGQFIVGGIIAWAIDY